MIDRAVPASLPIASVIRKTILTVFTTRRFFHEPDSLRAALEVETSGRNR